MTLVVVPLAALALFALRAAAPAVPGAPDLADAAAVAAEEAPVPGPPLPPGVPRADLAVALRPDPVDAEAGRPVTDALVASSKGPAATRRTTLVTTLPPGFRFRSAAAPPGTRCTPTGGTVTCTGPGLRPGESRTVRITSLVAERTAAGPVRRVARVSADLPDPVPRDGVAAALSRVTRSADLVAGVVGPGTPVVPGTRAPLLATLTNRGPASADGVVLAAVLPPGVTVLSAGVPGGTCTPGGSDVSCTLPGPLPPGAAATARLVVGLDAGYTADAVVPAVTATSTTPDPRPVGGTAVTRVPVTPGAELATTTTGPSALAAGGEGTWTTVVTNRGPSTARDVDVVGRARGAVITDSDTSGGDCAASACTVGTLAPGASARVRTVAAVPAGAPDGPVRLTTRARTSTPAAVVADPGRAPRPDGATGTPPPGVTTTAAANGADPATTDATAEVTRVADLAVAFSQGRPGGLGGALDLATDFTLRARNLGPSDATDAVLSAVVPPGFRPTAVTPGCALDGQRVTCRRARVPVGGEVAAAVSTTQLPGLLPSVLTGPRRLDAQVASSELDPVPGNDTAAATPGAPGAPDLAVTEAGPAPRAVAGEVVRRTLVVRNGGTATAPRVLLDEVLSEGATPVAIPPACRSTGRTTSCDLGGLAAGEARAVTLAARVAPERPAGPLVRRGTVRSAAGRGDPSPSDATTSTTTPVDGSADLRTTLARVGDGPVLAGGPSTVYRVRTTNAGPSTAPGVVLDLGAPPTGRPVLGATAATGACTVAATGALCPVAALAPGDAAEALVTVAATGDVLGAASTLSATATSVLADPTADDARAELTAPVTRAADLRTRIDAAPRARAVPAGSRTTFRVVLDDAGPSTASRAALSATVPPGAVAVSATSTRGRCAVRGARVDCAVGDLPAGGQAVATVVADVAIDARGPLTVTATGTSATPDPAPAGPSALALPVTPAPPPDPPAAPGTAGLPGLDPTVPNPSGPGEGLTIAAQIGRLPAGDALGLVLAGAAIPAVLGALAWTRRRRYRS